MIRSETMMSGLTLCASDRRACIGGWSVVNQWSVVKPTVICCSCGCFQRRPSNHIININI